MDYHIKCDCLDLKRTLFCGQCFRFKEQNGSFCGVVGDKYIELEQEADGILLKNVDENDKAFWLEYFDMSLDYNMLFKLFSADETLKYACEERGIRVLRQEPFETLISFIISQNNNIKRIGGIIERLCENFGTKINDSAYAFPTLAQLENATEESLAPLRAGFRAKYIVDAVQKVKCGEVDLKAIYAMSSDEGRESLKKIKGVGDKVADCVLLFAYNKLDCIPKDVWVKRIIAKYYPDGLPECMGKYGGIAQQYLFDYARKNKI